MSKPCKSSADGTAASGLSKPQTCEASTTPGSDILLIFIIFNGKENIVINTVIKHIYIYAYK
jgi:hypothetical protein